MKKIAVLLLALPTLSATGCWYDRPNPWRTERDVERLNDKKEEDWLLEHERERLRADVLKVGHHGSSTSSSDAFLTAVRPNLAIISVGAGNMYGHPSNDVLHALSRFGIDVLRTDDVGTVVVRTDGVHIEVEAKGEKWELARDSLRR